MEALLTGKSYLYILHATGLCLLMGELLLPYRLCLLFPSLSTDSNLGESQRYSDFKDMPHQCGPSEPFSCNYSRCFSVSPKPNPAQRTWKLPDRNPLLLLSNHFLLSHQSLLSLPFPLFHSFNSQNWHLFLLQDKPSSTASLLWRD